MGLTLGELEERMDYSEFRERMVNDSLPPVFRPQSDWLLATIAAWLLNFGRKSDFVNPADLLAGAKAAKTDAEVEAGLRSALRGR